MNMSLYVCVCVRKEERRKRGKPLRSYICVMSVFSSFDLSRKATRSAHTATWTHTYLKTREIEGERREERGEREEKERRKKRRAYTNKIHNAKSIILPSKNVEILLTKN